MANDPSQFTVNNPVEVAFETKQEAEQYTKRLRWDANYSIVWHDLMEYWVLSWWYRNGG